MLSTAALDLFGCAVRGLDRPGTEFPPTADPCHQPAIAILVGWRHDRPADRTAQEMSQAPCRPDATAERAVGERVFTELRDGHGPWPLLRAMNCSSA